MIDAFPPFQTYGGMDQDTYILPHDNVNTPLDESQRQPASATIWRHDNLNNFEHPSLLNNDAEYIYDTLSQAGYFDEPKRPYSYTHFMTFGPYDLLPGEKCKVVIAYVGAQGANSPKYDDYRRYPQPFNFAWMNLVDQVGNSTISFADRQREIPLGEDALFRHFQRALNVYAWGYDLPNQPPNVKVSWSSDLAGQNVLTWTAFGENAKDPDYESQEAQDLRGYRIYRSTQENQGPWELVTEFPFEDAHAGLLPNIQYDPSDVYRTNPSDSFPEGIPLRENQYVSGMASNAGPEIQGVYRFVDRSSRAGFPNWYSIRFYDSGHNDWQWKVDDDSLYQPARLAMTGSGKSTTIRFTNLPGWCQIDLYTVTGERFWTFFNDDPTRSEVTWQQLTEAQPVLETSEDAPVGPGIYFWRVTSLMPESMGKVQKGTFVVIK